MIINDHQGSSRIIKDHQGSSRIIKDHQGSSRIRSSRTLPEAQGRGESHWVEASKVSLVVGGSGRAYGSRHRMHAAIRAPGHRKHAAIRAPGHRMQQSELLVIACGNQSSGWIQFAARVEPKVALKDM
jgi:hypothetical protein